MQCNEAVWAEDVLEYFVGSYRGEEFIREFYNPDCYINFDNMQGVIYQKVQEVSSEVIQKYGFSAIPNVYGLMSEEALEASGVLRIRRQPYLDLYGQGVLIGFVDTGIDYTHEAFIAADGTSRIVSIWDQTIQEGVGTEAFPYGRFFSQEDINQALASETPLEIVPSQDEVGHGTFLAGVAAGNENRSREFSGVAPLSRLVIVKCKQAKQSYRDYYGIPSDVAAFQENDIMAGVSYILSVAQRENQPVIICLGLGTSMGNHNGSTNLGIFLMRYLSIPGVGIITCAGNEGNARHHHRVIRKEDTISISVESSLAGFMAQLWWRTPGGLNFDIISPSGEVFANIQAVSGVRRQYRFMPEGTVVEVYFSVAQELTREQVVVFRFVSPKQGIWKVRTRFDFANSNFSIWLPIRQFLEQEVFFLESDPNVTITNPGNTTNAITVSAYDVRNGALYLQAGRGFTPDGNVKPEIVAPGVDITGTYPRGRYGTMTGTSVAAAFAAGIGALFMQQYASEGANSNTLREAFIRGAVPRGEPYPNEEWGFGIVDAYRSITPPFV